MRTVRKRLFLISGICIPLVLVAVLPCLSYFRARAQAEALIAKSSQPLTPYSSRFCFVRSIAGQRGPCWNLAYDPDDFGVGPLTLAVTPTGEVVASNPSSALAKLRSLP